MDIITSIVNLVTALISLASAIVLDKINKK